MKTEFDLIVESYCKGHKMDKEMLLSHMWDMHKLFEDENNLMKSLVMYPDEFYTGVEERLKLEKYIKNNLYSKLFDYYSKLLSVFNDADVDSAVEKVELGLSRA